MSPEERAVIIEVLCGQALADHLGDVRNEEDLLWKLLGVPKLSEEHPDRYSDSAWRVTRARLMAAGEDPPSYYSDGWGSDEDDE